ncbi:GyrI-like domain-containing protein [Hydrotalea sp.]|uniref:GyrI-like domain-containing protein n=1 Tax=Hydrotalea sp. TaxID=2881279 RepID=UPI00260C1E94|nr:GyrI-like domain-containing protein [Hydrotalea sp.]
MKKWILIIVTLFIIFSVAVYLFIPQEATIGIIVKINSNENGITRLLQDTSHWHKWWNHRNVERGGVEDSTAHAFVIKNVHFSVTEQLYKGLKLLLSSGDEIYNSQISIIPAGIDSSYMLWQVKIPTGNNPFLKIIRYRTALQLKPAMQQFLARFTGFAENIENLYGIQLRQQGYADTYLVSTKIILEKQPTVSDIYTLINRLTDFAKGKLVYLPNGHPIYNITHWDKDSIQLMVAIPITKPISSEGKFEYKQMVKGNFIVTEVKGGPWNIHLTYQTLMQYFSDYHRTAMAIPFYRLMNEVPTTTDTAQWVTQIYQPVF